MKKVLLCSTALLGVGAMAGTAAASDGIKLSLGGFFNTAYMVMIDKKSGNGQDHFGKDRNTDAVKHNGEIYFTGEVTLDNGITAGARVELEAEQAGDQIDKSFVYFEGGFGRIIVGSQNDVFNSACVMPVGGSSNFSAFSPNFGGWNYAINNATGITSNSACTSALDNSQMISYFTPNFGGFQLGASYQPSQGAENYGQSGVNGPGGHAHATGEGRHNLSTYATYSYEGDGWGLNFGAGGSWQLEVEHNDGGGQTPLHAYQSGLNLNFGGLSVGAVVEYYNDLGAGNDDWVAGAGIEYAVDAWTVGMQYSHGNFKTPTGGGAGGHDTTVTNHVVLTGDYAMGPGINLDATVGYNWFHDNAAAADPHQDRYSGFEFGIGSAFAF